MYYVPLSRYVPLLCSVRLQLEVVKRIVLAARREELGCRSYTRGNRERDRERESESESESERERDIEREGGREGGSSEQKPVREEVARRRGKR